MTVKAGSVLPVNCVPNETKKDFAVNRSNGCKSIKVLEVRAGFLLLSRVAEGLPDKPRTVLSAGFTLPYL